MKNLSRVIFVSLMVGFLATPLMARSPQSQGPERGRAFEPSLAELALGTEGLETLVDVVLSVDGAIDEAGLVDLLSGRRHYTVFAPTNDAFQSLFDTVASLPSQCQPDLSDPYVLLAVLEYHIAPGDKRATGLVNSGSVRMINDDVAMIYVDNGEVVIENFPVDSKIGPADIRASNGIVHLVDQVLIPPTVAQGIQDCLNP